MLAKLAKFHFLRHFCRFDVGQLHLSSLDLHESEIPTEPSFPFGLNVAGLGRVFETHQTRQTIWKYKDL